MPSFAIAITDQVTTEAYLVVLVGEAEPLVERDGTVAVVVDRLELVGRASLTLNDDDGEDGDDDSDDDEDDKLHLPPVKAELLGKSRRSIDHPPKLILRHLTSILYLLQISFRCRVSIKPNLSSKIPPLLLRLHFFRGKL